MGQRRCRRLSPLDPGWGGGAEGHACVFAQVSPLNCLLAAIPARERVITCAEVFELRVPLPSVVAM
jgi:hypothetical protein